VRAEISLQHFPVSRSTSGAAKGQSVPCNRPGRGSLLPQKTGRRAINELSTGLSGWTSLIRHCRNRHYLDYELGMRERRNSDYLRGRGIVVAAVF